MKTQRILLSAILGGTLISVPAAIPVLAADNAHDKAPSKMESTEHNKSTQDMSRYSDRDRQKEAKNEQDKLEKALKVGHDKDFYRNELEKMGWKITSVNYNKPDYLEYEIVKNNSTYEVQIDLDKKTHKAKKVDVALNVWKAKATEKALNEHKAENKQAKNR